MSEDTRAERWLPVIGFEGFYEVSDHGRVRSLGRFITDRLGRTRWHKGRVRVLVPHPEDGHLQVGFKVDGVETLKKVHRLVLEAFVGPRPPGQEGCHGPGGVADNWLTNLRWDTKSENMLDINRYGTHHNTSKTTCPLDHQLAAPNLVPSALMEGRRNCLACDRASSKVRYWRLRGVVLALQAEADGYYRKIMGLVA